MKLFGCVANSLRNNEALLFTLTSMMMWKSQIWLATQLRLCTDFSNSI